MTQFGIGTTVIHFFAKKPKNITKNRRFFLSIMPTPTRNLFFDDIRKANNDSSESLLNLSLKKYLLAVEDLVWVRQQIQNRYKDRFFAILFCLMLQKTHFPMLWNFLHMTFTTAGIYYGKPAKH